MGHYSDEIEKHEDLQRIKERNRLREVMNEKLKSDILFDHLIKIIKSNTSGCVFIKSNDRSLYDAIESWRGKI